MFGKGTVSINAENIMPVIKQWLYSDKDIFVRELVSNGCDAISKHQAVWSPRGEAEDDADAYRVDVIADQGSRARCTFIDNGLGMTARRGRKVHRAGRLLRRDGFHAEICQGRRTATQSGIIGHFGLGFYSCLHGVEQGRNRHEELHRGRARRALDQRGRHGIRHGGIRPHRARHLASRCTSTMRTRIS